jgi:hypothetical protein
MPLRGADLLKATSVWVAAAVLNGEELPVQSDLEESPTDRDPRSIRWILESSEKMGQIVLWTDGQAELDLADVVSGEVRSEHMQIDEQEGLEGALSVVRDWVLRAVAA